MNTQRTCDRFRPDQMEGKTGVTRGVKNSGEILEMRVLEDRSLKFCVLTLPSRWETLTQACGEKTRNTPAKRHTGWMRVGLTNTDCEAVCTFHPSELLACSKKSINAFWMNKAGSRISATELV